MKRRPFSNELSFFLSTNDNKPTLERFRLAYKEGGLVAKPLHFINVSHIGKVEVNLTQAFQANGSCGSGLAKFGERDLENILSNLLHGSIMSRSPFEAMRSRYQ